MVVFIIWVVLMILTALAILTRRTGPINTSSLALDVLFFFDILLLYFVLHGARF